jgi:Alpha/beta hydrolase family
MWPVPGLDLTRLIREAQGGSNGVRPSARTGYLGGNKVSESEVWVVLAHGAWTDGFDLDKGDRWAAKRRCESGRCPAATDIACRGCRGARSNARTDGWSGLVGGHAHAGAVISSTRDEKVAALVYVAALAPDKGETVADVFYRAEPHQQAQTGFRSSRAHLVARAGLRHGICAARLGAGASSAGRHAAAARGGAIGVQVVRPAWKDRPSWFLVGEEDRMIPAETQRFMAERMRARVRTAPVDHVPILTAPSTVVDIVMAAVREVEKGS